MTVNEVKHNILCLEYRQQKEDDTYGSCLWARFYFNLDKYELLITSDCGNYGYKWCETPNSECFLDLMARIDGDYLLGKLCGQPEEFNYEATKENFYDYACDEDDKKRLDEIFDEIECRYIPESGETFIEMFEQENDGWWEDVWEYPIYDYTACQKRIVEIYVEAIQPKIREIIENDNADKRGKSKKV